MNKLLLTSFLLLAGCSSVFIYDRYFVGCVGSDQCPHADFHADITTCVSTFDPDHLDQVGTSDGYQISGWFIDKERIEPVINCMSSKGWKVFGAAL